MDLDTQLEYILDRQTNTPEGRTRMLQYYDRMRSEMSGEAFVSYIGNLYNNLQPRRRRTRPSLTLGPIQDNRKRRRLNLTLETTPLIEQPNIFDVSCENRGYFNVDPLISPTSLDRQQLNRYKMVYNFHNWCSRNRIALDISMHSDIIKAKEYRDLQNMIQDRHKHRNIFGNLSGGTVPGHQINIPEDTLYNILEYVNFDRESLINILSSQGSIYDRPQNVYRNPVFNYRMHDLGNTTYYYPPSHRDITEPGPTCPICLQDYRHGETIGEIFTCGHSFHNHCARAWFSQKQTCPICYAELLPSSFGKKAKKKKRKKKVKRRVRY